MTGRNFLCFLAFVLGQNPVIAEERELKIYDPEIQPGKGVVIEIEEDTALREEKAGNMPAENVADKKKRHGSKRVELIVGGQGENGVAKRSALIIDE